MSKLPRASEKLTAVEEAVIARAHSIISIVLLRFSAFGPCGSYHRIRGHTVVLSAKTAKVPLPQERWNGGERHIRALMQNRSSNPAKENLADALDSY